MLLPSEKLTRKSNFCSFWPKSGFFGPKKRSGSVDSIQNLTVSASFWEIYCPHRSTGVLYHCDGNIAIISESIVAELSSIVNSLHSPHHLLKRYLCQKIEKGTDDLRQNFLVDGPRVQAQVSQAIIKLNAFQSVETLTQLTCHICVYLALSFIFQRLIHFNGQISQFRTKVKETAQIFQR